MGRKICVLGAGVSGLACIKNALDEGFDVVCFEQRSWLGGLWNFTHERSSEFAIAPASTICNVSKQNMSYSDFPVPMEFPNFMPVNVYQKYLEMYAENFNLVDKITFNCKVLQVQPHQDYKENGKWEVSYETRVVGKVEVKRERKVFDAVMICSGIYWNRFTPEIPGNDVFQGQQIHSADYRNGKGFEGKKIIVVGLGNTGGDIAVDLSHQSSNVYLSTRHGAWILSRMGTNGKLGDHLGLSRLANIIPFTIKNWMIESIVNNKFDHEVFGLKTNVSPLRQKLTINDELPHKIITGSVIMKSKLVKLTAHSAYFEDSTQVDNVDCIIYATGFRHKFPFLAESVMKIDGNGRPDPLYKFVFPVHLAHPTLAFIGIAGVNGPDCPIVDIQSRWALKIFKKECFLPNKDVMTKDVKDREMQICQVYGPERMEYLRVLNLVDYLDDISSLFGAKPNLPRLFLTDPKLALRCFFGPCVPFQYRLMGPGSRDGAKAAIESVPESVVIPTRTRTVEVASETKSSGLMFGLMAGLVVILSLIFFLL